MHVEQGSTDAQLEYHCRQHMVEWPTLPRFGPSSKTPRPPRLGAEVCIWKSSCADPEWKRNMVGKSHPGKTYPHPQCIRYSTKLRARTMRVWCTCYNIYWSTSWKPQVEAAHGDWWGRGDSSHHLASHPQCARHIDLDQSHNLQSDKRNKSLQLFRTDYGAQNEVIY